MFTQSLMSVQVGKQPSIIEHAQNTGTEGNNNSVLGFLKESQSATNVHEAGEQPIIQGLFKDVEDEPPSTSRNKSVSKSRSPTGKGIMQKLFKSIESKRKSTHHLGGSRKQQKQSELEQKLEKIEALEPGDMEFDLLNDEPEGWQI